MSWDVTICGPNGTLEWRGADADSVANLLRAYSDGEHDAQFNIEETDS